MAQRTFPGKPAVFSVYPVLLQTPELPGEAWSLMEEIAGRPQPAQRPGSLLAWTNIAANSWFACLKLEHLGGRGAVARRGQARPSPRKPCQAR